MTFGNKRSHCESSSPPWSAVKLWDDLVLPVVMGKQRLLCPSCLPVPKAVTLLSTRCAGQVCALSPAPRDSGHQGSAQAGSAPAGGTWWGGWRWAAPPAQGRTPEAGEASADGTRDMSQMQFLPINVVTLVRWGVALLAAPGPALAGTALWGWRSGIPGGAPASGWGASGGWREEPGAHASGHAANCCLGEFPKSSRCPLGFICSARKSIRAKCHWRDESVLV